MDIFFLSVLSVHHLIQQFVLPAAFEMFIVFCIIIGKLFLKLNTSITGVTTKSNYKIKEYKKTTPFRALFFKEISKSPPMETKPEYNTGIKKVMTNSKRESLKKTPSKIVFMVKRGSTNCLYYCFGNY